ncbi:putative late blight resistance protein homolog R1A-4 [Lycium ferocissimum]|uniref:putative late blight resistance protein homolog R1A-4 n=1 Tax=Lycium ferocissimum TaxID=112874 RepID=UPI002814A100|nr:putative late blight resistance protein homolog R1A-4 [Lycium ferocissimum]
MAHAVVTSLMTTLEQVLQFNPTLISENRGPVDSLYGKLSFLQAFLEDMGNQINDQEALTVLEKKIRDAVFKAEDNVDLCLRRIHTDNNQDAASHKLYDELQQIIKIMDSIQEEVMKLKNDHQHVIDQPPTVPLPLRSSGPVLDEENTLVGMEDDFNIIRDQLIRHERGLNVVSIVGMGGIGKTTLAITLFNDTSVFCRFDVSSWVTVSQNYNAREMLLDILSFRNPGTKAMYSNMSDDQLLEQVYRKLKRKRYLIVLDDIWCIEPFDLVKRSFPDDENGSRIMITTRLSEVADSASNGCLPYHMPFLNCQSSWNLLSDKVFGKEDCPTQLEEIGKQIAKQCQGLPLSVVVIAGILSNINRTYDDWKKVAEDVNTHVGSISEQCLTILALSYNYLPCNLKACFLYLGIFLENAEIPVDKLIRIWVAEGFLKTIIHKNSEEVAEECLEGLVGRSLIMVSRRRASGKIKTCRIHDLLRLLCLREGKAEKFFHVISKYFEVPPEKMEIQRRICLHPDALENWYLGMEKGNSGPVRTMLYLRESHTFKFDYQCYNIVNSHFQMLRVLDVESIPFSNFPSAIPQLVHLRYVTCTTGTEVPASISNLWNLQTFIVHPFVSQFCLPLEIWNMSSLRHFYPGGMYMPLPPKEQNFSGLENLETLDSISVANSDWKEIFAAIPKVKKLVVCLHPGRNMTSKLFDSLISLVDLQKLRIHLDISPYENFSVRLPTPLWDVFPTFLKSLTLVGTRLLWEDMTTLGNLPNIEVLRLKCFAFQGRNWNLNEGGFGKLKLLQINRTNLVHWEASSDSLPRLEFLILKYCCALEEIPIEIGDVPTLKLIELHDCSEAAATSAEEMLQEQQSLGNEVLVVRSYNTGE